MRKAIVNVFVPVCPFPWRVDTFHEILVCWEFLLKSIGHAQIYLKSDTSPEDKGTSVSILVTNMFIVALCYQGYQCVYSYGLLGTVVTKVNMLCG